MSARAARRALSAPRAQDVDCAGRDDQHVTAAISDSKPMNSFARWVSGIASVGLKAIEFVDRDVEIVVQRRRPVLRRASCGILVLRELEVRRDRGARPSARRDRAAAVDLPEDERERDHVDEQDDGRAGEELQSRSIVRAAADERPEHEDDRRRGSRARAGRAGSPRPCAGARCSRRDARSRARRRTRAARAGSASTSQIHQSSAE